MSGENMSIQSKKRLIHDVKSLYKYPLHNQGIYYIHDDDDFTLGYAMIIGPAGTPYEYGMFFFKFEFPVDYPYSPPKVTFHTNNGIVRFHPNLYKNGKVCLSIINTWNGEGWTSCQSIKSILLTLVSILDEKPFLNEPGIKEDNNELKKYNDIIEFYKYKTAIYQIGSDNINIPFISLFKYNIDSILIENKDFIINKLEKLSIEYPNTSVIFMDFYKFKAIINYKSVYKNIIHLYNNI